MKSCQCLGVHSWALPFSPFPWAYHGPSAVLPPHRADAHPPWKQVFQWWKLRWISRSWLHSAILRRACHHNWQNTFPSRQLLWPKCVPLLHLVWILMRYRSSQHNATEIERGTECASDWATDVVSSAKCSSGKISKPEIVVLKKQRDSTRFVAIASGLQ